MNIVIHTVDSFGRSILIVLRSLLHTISVAYPYTIKALYPQPIKNDTNSIASSKQFAVCIFNIVAGDTILLG